MTLKKVKVEFISAGWQPRNQIYREDGILNDNGLVLTVDEIGGIGIYKLERMITDTLVVVSGECLLEENPKLTLDFILDKGDN